MSSSMSLSICSSDESAVFPDSSYPTILLNIATAENTTDNLDELSASSVADNLDEPIASSVAEEYFVKEGNKLTVLCAMGVGTKDAVGNDIGDFEAEDNVFPTAEMRKWCPTNAVLKDEVQRRKKLLNIAKVPNAQKPRLEQMNWLRRNPIIDDKCVAFLRARIEHFIGAFKEAKEAKKTFNFSPEREQWAGIIPFLRLIHCITDKDANKEAFHLYFTVLTHQELDGRNNPDTARTDVWTLLSDLWNDDKYNPSSTVYSDLHDDFKESLDLSHAKIEKMGFLTPDKAKAKFFKLKNMLILVKNNWELSGNGDGSMARYVPDDMDKEEAELIEGSDRSNFLHGRTPALLYLWNKAEEHDLLRSVCQQLEQSIGFDSCEMSEPKRRKCNEDEDVEIINNIDNNDHMRRLTKSMEEANDLARESLDSTNQRGKAEERRYLLSLVRDMRSDIYKFEDELLLLDPGTPRSTTLQKRVDDINVKINFHEDELGNL